VLDCRFAAAEKPEGDSGSLGYIYLYGKHKSGHKELVHLIADDVASSRQRILHVVGNEDVGTALLRAMRNHGPYLSKVFDVLVIDEVKPDFGFDRHQYLAMLQGRLVTIGASMIFLPRVVLMWGNCKPCINIAKNTVAEHAVFDAHRPFELPNVSESKVTGEEKASRKAHELK
jgi:hypothetical protein